MDIEKLFSQSADTKIFFEGKELVRADALQLGQPETKVRITFVSTSGDFKQGMAIETEGEFLVNDLSIKNKLTLWEHTAPKTFEMTIVSRDQWLVLYNIWKPENELLNFSSGSGNAAMHLTVTGNTRRYACNDGKGSGLQNLVFDLEIIPESETSAD